MPRSTPSGRTNARRSRSAATLTPAPFVESLVSAERTLRGGLAHDADLARDAAMHASDFRKLATVQVEWAAEQWARSAQAWSALWSALFDVQAACWRDAESRWRAGLEPWLAAGRHAPPIDETLAATPVDLSPEAVMQRAADAWTAWGQVCVNAMEHDLTEERGTRS